jgi:hypothetical protein
MGNNITHKTWENKNKVELIERHCVRVETDDTHKQNTAEKSIL